MSRNFFPDQGNKRPVQNEIKIVRVPAQVYPYTAGVLGGLLGGLGMIPVAMAYGIISGYGLWYPVNLIAATLIRSWQQATVIQMARFSITGLLVGLSIHLLTAVGLGLVFAILLPTLPRSPIFWAFVVGPLLWAGASFAALPLVNPIMAQFINWSSFAIANIIYSLVMGVWIARTPKIPAC